MILLKETKEIKNQLLILKKSDKRIGFVPTMGALHEGHLSLVKRAKMETDVVVCSIFVNPTQFNQKKDFDKYPITLERDIELLLSVKCDILFLPSVAEMYPDGFLQKKSLDFGYTALTLEGEYRPGHFDGMAQIVEKLLLTIMPHQLYMGQKDFQQALICKQLIKKRKLTTALVVCAVVREKDGLAMSSRNIRLSTHARSVAPEIFTVLKWAKKEVQNLRKANVVSGLKAQIQAIEIEAFDRLAANKKIQVEYLAIRDAQSLKVISTLQKESVVLVACWLNGVRLIDNVLA